MNRSKDKPHSFGNLGKGGSPSIINASLEMERSEKQSLSSYVTANRKRFIRKSIEREYVFDPRTYITNELSYDDVVDLKEVFDTYDSTQMGVLLPNDIKLFLQQNGFNPSKKTVYEIVAEFDAEETGGLSFRDFMFAMEMKPRTNETRKEIATIFRKYDRAGKGFIDLQDMKDINRHVKEQLDDDTLLLMLRHADSNNDGRISFDDFYAVMVRHVY